MGEIKSGLLKTGSKEVQIIRYFLWRDKRKVTCKYRWLLKTGDCLIEVTAWTSLTLIVYSEMYPLFFLKIYICDPQAIFQIFLHIIETKFVSIMWPKFLFLMWTRVYHRLSRLWCIKVKICVSNNWRLMWNRGMYHMS